MAPTCLLGPPPIQNLSLPPIDPFMDLLEAKFDDARKSPEPETQAPPIYPTMGFSNGGSAAFLATGNPCLDFFFDVVPGSSVQSLQQKLQLAWAYSPLTTLKLIFNLRAVRGNGKSDKEGFFVAAYWLFNNHCKTLAGNVPSFADFGCFKDLPEILFRLLEGFDVRKTQKENWRQRKSGRLKGPNVYLRQINSCRKRKPNSKDNDQRRRKPAAPAEIRILRATQRLKLEEETARTLREDKNISRAKRVVERLSRDPSFQLLYESISDHFAQTLKADLQFVKLGNLSKVSLAAKWCPSLDSSYDRSTLLCESIARKVFDKKNYPEYEGIEDAHYAYRVRDRLRKEALVPLRKVLELPEVFIGSNSWDLIPYKRVPSVAMKFYKEKFLDHDYDRFSEYLEAVKAGEAKIAAGAMLPHEIIGEVLKSDAADGGQVAELQWKRMVDDLVQKGKLRNCMAICDVSMWGETLNVSLALGLLVSELSEEPWKGKLITFGNDPKFYSIQRANLRSRIQCLKGMPCSFSANFQKVFDKILKVAVEAKLRPELMITRLFVLSGMEFDSLSENPWDSDYDAIKRKFSEKGYGEVIPEIIFWNLQGYGSKPVCKYQNNVAMVSGFSKNLLKIFLERNGDINPVVVMEHAISGPEYEKLIVLD